MDIITKFWLPIWLPATIKNMSITIFANKSKTDKNGNIKVFLRISHAGKRFFVFTGLTSTEPFKGASFPKKDKNRLAKNNRLNEIVLAAERLQIENMDLSASQLKDLIMKEIDPTRKNKGKYLTGYMEQYAQTKTGRTATLYKQTLKRVSDFDMDLPLDRIDHKWLSDFERRCAKTMRTNTISIHMRNIRAVFNWCIMEGYTENYPFARYKIKSEKTAKRSLSVKQLRILRDYPCEDFQKPYRDIFMLMFYLIGINATDLLHLKHENLKDGRIEYQRAKTGKFYSIKVEPEAMTILKRYKGKNYLIDPLDRFKDHLDWLHHFNDGLKTIGKTYRNGCKPTGKSLFPDLSSYWSRHTWGTLAAEIDTPIDVIAHALGHNIPGLDVTSIYIRFNEKKVDKANRAVIDFVNSK